MCLDAAGLARSNSDHMALKMKTLPLFHYVICEALVNAMDQTYIFQVV